MRCSVPALPTSDGCCSRTSGIEQALLLGPRLTSVATSSFVASTRLVLVLAGVLVMLSAGDLRLAAPPAACLIVSHATGPGGGGPGAEVAPRGPAR